jgi:outer membrane protein OmpA-like peptidoglycan-associated protein
MPGVGLRLRILAVFGCMLASGASGAAALENLAASRAGGRLVYFSSQYNDTDWNAEHLIDGSPNKGWAGTSGGPQVVVLAFENDGLATIEDVVVNPYTREAVDTWVKKLEVQVSTTLPFKDFRTVGTLELSDQGVDQVLTLAPPVQARYVKILFRANGGGGYMEAGEIKVMGTPVANAAPAPDFEDLTAPDRGATIETASSEYNDTDWAAANLLAPSDRNGWAGKSGTAQEVVIALATPTEITDVSIDNYAREAPENWAKAIEVQTSDTAYKGFQSAGRLTLPKQGDLHTLTFARPVVAQYVKFLFSANHGGSYMEANRVKIWKARGAAASAGAAPASPPSTVAQQLESTGRAVSHEIHFATNSAEILPDSAPVLGEIADLLQANPQWELIIEGHTDNVGGAEFNLELSRKRAEAVKRWLVDRRGIDELRLTTAGRGLTKPIADNGTENGRAQNRRVELVRR